MPSPELTAAYEAARERHAAAVDDLVPVVIDMALATIAETLPGAEILDTHGEMNDDWVFTLRIRRVLDADGRVLYDAETGHNDPEVERRIDEAGTEFLDLLLDLTGDEYLGRKTVERIGSRGP